MDVAKLRGRGRRSSWTDKEILELRELWGTMRDIDLARKLGKSLSVVRLKASVLNLREEKGRRVGCRPGSTTYPWSREEDLILIKNCGQLSIFELMELLPRRNRVAIERHCYELGYSPTQGTYTRGKIERDTGYDWRQIKRARDAIGQNWKRYGSRKYMITWDQVQEIIEYLKNETRKWSKHYGLDGCRVCGATGSTERERHSGDGLCKRCWDRRRHMRSWIVSAFYKGRCTLMNEEVWRVYLCGDEVSETKHEVRCSLILAGDENNGDENTRRYSKG